MATLRDERGFWSLIDASRPSMAALRTSLEALDREGLENFYGFFESLAWDVRSDEGTFVNDAIGYLSEDGAEDLANWIVSQGRAYWERVNEDLSVLGAEYLRMSDVQAGRPSDVAVKWELEPRDSTYGRVGHLSLVMAMYQARFARTSSTPPRRSPSASTPSVAPRKCESTLLPDRACKVRLLLV